MLLTRSFSQPEDRPQARLQELLHAARAVVRLLEMAPFGPGRWSPSVPIQEFGRSLSPEQLNALRRGAVLPVGGLPSTQRTLALRAIYTNAFLNTHHAWQGLAHELASAQLSYLWFTPRQIGFNTPELAGLARLVYRTRDWEGRPADQLIAVAPAGVIGTNDAPGPGASPVGPQPGEEPGPTSGASSSLGRADRAAAGDAGGTQGLDTVVRLPLGDTTAGAVAAGIAGQTRLPVRVAGYLEDRRLIVCGEPLPARTLLDALCRLQDWTWRKDEAGGVLIEAPGLRRPRGVADLVALIPQALPRDFRRLLGVGRSVEEIVKDPLPANPAPITDSPPYRIETQIRRNLQGLYGVLGDFPVQSLWSQAQSIGPFAFSRLSPQQREALLLVRVLEAVAQSRYGLFQNRLFTYERDPDSAGVEPSAQGVLWIGKTWVDATGRNTERFGTALDGHPGPAPGTGQPGSR